MSDQEIKRSRAWLWATVTVAALVVAYFAIHSFTHEPVPVRTSKVSYQDIISTVSTNGKVEPIEDFQAHAPQPGVVQNVLVDVNAHVQRGQELLRLDTSDAKSRVSTAQATLQSSLTTLQNMQQGGTQDELISEKADLAAAQSQEREAAATLSALQGLQARGAASANEVAKAQQGVSDAHAKIVQLQQRRTQRYSTGDVAAQKAQVSQARSGLSAAESGYSGVDVRAPFSGTVYSIPVAQYDYVSGGEALLNLADLNRIQVRAYFDEPEIGRLADGQSVSIVWDAKPNQLWHGHVVQAPTTIINYGTRNVGECLITVDDAKGDLLPNTNVTVKVTTQQKAHVLSIPREALRTEGTVDYVYRIVSGKLRRTPVTVGSVNLTRAEITGGIAEGDTVVLSATTEADLNDGLQVKAQP